MLLEKENLDRTIFEASLVEMMAFYNDGLSIDPFNAAEIMGAYYVGYNNEINRFEGKRTRKTGNRKKNV